MKRIRKRWPLVLNILILVVSLCACQPNIKEDKTENVSSGDEKTEGSTEESVEKEQETDLAKETLGLIESVAESVRADLDYFLPEEEFEEIAEMLHDRETDRWAKEYYLAASRNLPEPGSYSFRVYADISDDTLFFHRKPIYYVWAESLQNSYAYYGESEKGFCSEINNDYSGWWYMPGRVSNLDDYTEEEFVLLHEGEYVVEDTTEMVGYDFPEKKELLIGLWINMLQNLYDDYGNQDQFYLSACITDFTSYHAPEIFAELYYNWSIWESGHYFCLERSGDFRDFRMSWAMGGEFAYSAKRYQETRGKSVLVADGLVTKEWSETVERTGMLPLQEYNWAGVCGAVLGAVANHHLEETGTITGKLQATCYLTEINDMTGAGVWWFRYNGSEPIKVNVDYENRKEWRSSAYEYSLDETALFDEGTVSDCLMKLTIDLNTECSYFASEEVVEDIGGNMAGFETFNNHKGYLDELVQDKYPTTDYDGDGLDDRLYYANSIGSELCLHFGNGEQLSMGKPLNSMYFGAVRGVDVTGDGVDEVIYCNRIVGTGGNYNYYGIWHQEKGEWTRIPIDESNAQEKEQLAGQFDDMPIQVKRLSDTLLSIFQPNNGKADVFDIGTVAMEHIWPTDNDQTIYTKIKSNVIDLKENGLNREWELCVSVRIGTGELFGKLMYQNGQWVVNEWKMQIVE